MLENYDVVPKIMKETDLWCCWKKEDRENEKVAKVPYNPLTGKQAKVNDIGTFVPFANVLTSQSAYDGVGILIYNEISAIDIDNCVDDNGIINDTAREIITIIDSYTEISPSGHGIRIFFKVPNDFVYNTNLYYIKTEELEVYISNTSNRYVTVTGNSIGKSSFREVTTECLLLVLNKFMLHKPKDEFNRTAKPYSGQISNESYFNKWLMKDERLYKLYHSNAFNVEDQSVTDFSLCCKLAYWCNKDAAEIEDVFIRSPYGQSRFHENPSKMERDDYLRKTINKAITSVGRTAEMDDFEFREKVKQDFEKKPIQSTDSQLNKKSSLTLELFEKFLNENSITIKYNEIINKTEITGLPNKLSRSNSLNTFPIFCKENLKKSNITCSKADLEDFIIYVADINRYNPVKDMLVNNQWDGIDRLPIIYEILNIFNDQHKVYIKKWLHQCVAMALNDESNPWGADGVLVIQGPQGIGKTRFFKIISINNAWFLEGANINVDVKDSIIKATSRWIVELGELDSTLKREQEALKAFITANSDTIRYPYARADSTKPRRTSYCGTVNPEQYLRDETGSRRFWTVPVTNIDLIKLGELTIEWIAQLWLQAYKMFCNETQGFRLTKQEQEQLININSNHNKPLMFEDEIRDILDLDDEISQDWKWYNAAHVLRCLDNKRITAEQFGKVIKKIQRDQPLLQILKTRNGKEYFLPIKKGYQHD